MLLFLPTLMFGSHSDFGLSRATDPSCHPIFVVDSQGNFRWVSVPRCHMEPKGFGRITMCTACTVHNRGLWKWDGRQRDQAQPFYVDLLPPSLCQVKTPDESRECGRISKQWGGLLREALTDTDDLAFQFPLDLDVRVEGCAAWSHVPHCQSALAPPPTTPLLSLRVLSASWPPARRGSETESLGFGVSRPGFDS